MFKNQVKMDKFRNIVIIFLILIILLVIFIIKIFNLKQKIDYSKYSAINIFETIKKEKEFDYLDIEAEKLKIIRELDLIGDGKNEALIELGFGGVYTDYYIILNIKNKELNIIKFKDESQKILPIIFIKGYSLLNWEEFGFI